MQAGTAPSRWAVLRGGEHLWQAPRTHCPAGDATEKKDSLTGSHAHRDYGYRCHVMM